MLNRARYSCSSSLKQHHVSTSACFSGTTEPFICGPGLKHDVCPKSDDVTASYSTLSGLNRWTRYQLREMKWNSMSSKNPVVSLFEDGVTDQERIARMRRAVSVLGTVDRRVKGLISLTLVTEGWEAFLCLARSNLVQDSNQGFEVDPMSHATGHRPPILPVVSAGLHEPCPLPSTRIPYVLLHIGVLAPMICFVHTRHRSNKHERHKNSARHREKGVCKVESA